MPADTFSSVLGVLLMGTGNDNNTWGSNANAQVFQIFEDAIAGVLANSVSGGTLDLSASPPPAAASQARHAILAFSGALASTQTVIVPNLTKLWVVWNNTSGAAQLLMKTPGGATILIPQGAIVHVFCDGQGSLRRIGARTGEIFAHAGGGAPAGSVLCDGSAYSRTVYSELYALIGTLWGAGDGVTTFNVPNLQDTGRFLRALQPGTTAVGQVQSNAFSSHTHALSGSVAATASETSAGGHNHGGATGSHTHAVHGTVTGTPGGAAAVPNASGWVAGAATNFGSTDGATASISTDGAHTHTITVSVSNTLSLAAAGAAENRPEAAVVLYCIRV